MFRKFFLFALLIQIPGASAQSTRPQSPEGKPSSRMPADTDQEVGLPEDMRVKMLIIRREGEHKKVLEDVEKLSELSTEISKGYVERKRISSDDVRKLGAIEKLAKHVLTNAGGDEVDQKVDEKGPVSLAEAIDKLTATAENIKKVMTTETRFVVSATVISDSNEVISLARFIKRQKTD